MAQDRILLVGGYGEVGRRLAAQLEATLPGRVIVAGRHGEQARGSPARRIDVNDPASIEPALEGIGVVVACVRQREPHLLRAAARRGIAYTSIAPPWIPWPETEPLRQEAKRTGARIILGTGLEPGISSVLVRSAAERLGQVDVVETALLLSVGDAYGADSMAFLLEEVKDPYEVTVERRAHRTRAFEGSQVVRFPAPIGPRRAYTMPFTDARYYAATVSAKTAIARIALDPPWLAPALALLLRGGLRRALGSARARDAVGGLVAKRRGAHGGLDRYALVVEVRGGPRVIRSTIVGRQQATATALGAAATVEALWLREVDGPGVWLAEQVLAPEPFFARLAAAGIVPETEELSTDAPPRARSSEPR